jgi:Tol biopolymer transport system component
VDIANGGLFVVNADGSGLTRIAGDEDTLYFGAAWSPDGRRIAVTRSLNQTSEIHLGSADGSQFTQLTSNGRNNYLPRWSPDGTMIVYVSQLGGDTTTSELYNISADGTGETRLTENTAWEYGATWTSDGTHMFFGSERTGEWRIYRMNADGSDAQLLATEAHGNAPALSPDDRTIAFTSDRDGDDDIWLMSTDGSGQRNLTANDDHDDNPAWSPDGTRILFGSDRSGKNEIYLISVATGETTQITSSESGDPVIPSFSPDGTRIVFAAWPVD